MVLVFHFAVGHLPVHQTGFVARTQCLLQNVGICRLDSFVVVLLCLDYLETELFVEGYCIFVTDLNVPKQKVFKVIL